MRLSTCDVLFGRMDSIEGRDTLHRIADLFTLPYIDIGIRIDADGNAGVESVSSAVHYVQLGGATLRSRGVYSDADLNADIFATHRSAVLRGSSPTVRGIDVDRPAVISVIRRDLTPYPDDNDCLLEARHLAAEWEKSLGPPPLRCPHCQRPLAYPVEPKAPN